MESTLFSVYLAETTFKNLPATGPSQQDLQSRFLLELLAPYERSYILQRLGIPISENYMLYQKEDCKETLLRGPSDTSGISIPVIPDFNRDALGRAFSCKPESIQLIRAIRILQCIYEIGSLSVLNRFALDLNKPLQSKSDAGCNMEILLHLHRYLDKEANERHLSVSRSRYLKYCYFESYQTAVDALHVKKERSRDEKKKVDKRKRTATYKNGLSTYLPSIPITDSINASYNMLTKKEKANSAANMVKTAIVRGIHNSYGAKEDEIFKRMGEYLNEGQTMHLILKGSNRLHPGLLLFFPSQEGNIPSLDISGMELEHKERKKLLKPIKVQE